MYGLDKNSKLNEIIEKHNGTATKYKVVEETIDLDKLREEKDELDAQLAEKEPTDSELIELAKSFHSYYSKDIASINKRITEIEDILNG